jgi:arsenic resistance protein ArsH
MRPHLQLFGDRFSERKEKREKEEKKRLAEQKAVEEKN